MPLVRRGTTGETAGESEVLCSRRTLSRAGMGSSLPAESPARDGVRCSDKPASRPDRHQPQGLDMIEIILTLILSLAGPMRL